MLPTTWVTPTSAMFGYVLSVPAIETMRNAAAGAD